MKMKRLCALAVLLTSSLAGAANNSASKSEDQYSPFYNTPNEIRHVFMAIYRPVAYYDLFGLL